MAERESGLRRINEARCEAAAGADFGPPSILTLPPNRLSYDFAIAGVRTVRLSLRCVYTSVAGALLAYSAAHAAGPPPDLGDLAQGSYNGDVISDARGSSQSDVGITVTKTGLNTVSVKSDYARIPGRTFRLTRAMDTIQNAGGTEVFLLDLSKSPRRLDLTIDDASWSGELLLPD